MELVCLSMGYCHKMTPFFAIREERTKKKAREEKEIILRMQEVLKNTNVYPLAKLVKGEGGASLVPVKINRHVPNDSTSAPIIKATDDGEPINEHPP